MPHRHPRRRSGGRPGAAGGSVGRPVMPPPARVLRPAGWELRLSQRVWATEIEQLRPEFLVKALYFVHTFGVCIDTSVYFSVYTPGVHIGLIKCVHLVYAFSAHQVCLLSFPINEHLMCK